MKFAKAKTVIGYCDNISVKAGEVVQFKVNCYEEGDYTADLVRIVCGDRTPGGAGYEEKLVDAPFSGVYRGREQKVNIGSYGCVDIPSEIGKQLDESKGFSLQAVVYSTTPNKGLQGVLGTWNRTSGTGASLIIANDGSLGLIFSNESGKARIVSTGLEVPKRRWLLVSASYDRASRVLSLRQKLQAPSIGESSLHQEWEFFVDEGISCQGTNFLFAGLAEGIGGVTTAERLWVDDHFNGKIDRPRWSSCPLLLEKIEALNDASGGPWPEFVVGAWDFSKEISSSLIINTTSQLLNGKSVNLPSRAVTGFNWDGSEQNWRYAPEQYGAIHFHDDDLYDCEWDTDFTFEVPSGLTSGIYAARLRFGGCEDHVVFFVRPEPGRSDSKILFLASTATYMAYGNNKIGAEIIYQMTGETKYLDTEYQTIKAHPEFGLSNYDYHSDGSGVRYSSRLRPLVDMRPGTRKMWSLTADTLTAGWLEKSGYTFDVATDEDLDRDGVDLLKNYRVIISGAHPEYCSKKMRDALDLYLKRGGRFLYLGGNGFYLRIVYSSEFPGALELRRVENAITFLWDEEVGQHYHSFNGEYGGAWERSENSQYRALGVGFVGMANSVCNHYKVNTDLDERAAFVVAGVGEDIVNNFGEIYGPLTTDEYDKCNVEQGSPNHTVVIASSQPQSGTVYQFGTAEADMTFFECQNGGSVFSASTISWNLGLALNNGENEISRVTANVLDRFLDPAPFNVS